PDEVFWLQSLLLLRHDSHQTSGFTSADIAARISASAKTASMVSSKLQAYSWRNHRSPKTRFSSARKSAVIRGHWSAVTVILSQRSEPDQASQKAPLLPNGVLSIRSRPRLTASMGRTLAYRASDTRAASSTTSSAAPEKP